MKSMNSVLLAFAVGLSFPAVTLPTRWWRSGNGAANIASAGNLLTISQTSDRAIINWGSFNIANGETTLFQFNGLAGVGSAVLNRVNIGNPSTIAGMLRSTIGVNGPVGGTVMILNQAASSSPRPPRSTSARWWPRRWNWRTITSFEQYHTPF